MALESNMGLTEEQIQNFQNQSVSETNTYSIDWINGRLSGNIDGIDAVHQYIYKTLKTECNKFLIYDLSMGTGIKALIRQQNVSRDYIETEIPRQVRKALKDERILRVYDFRFEYPEGEPDSVCIKFHADTIYGRTSEEVTI